VRTNWGTTLRHLITRAAATALLLASGAACAQSTDGYHSFQVFPLVVDTGSFTQQFNFTTPNAFPVTVKVRFFPGDDGAGNPIGPPMNCPNFVIPAQGLYTSNSLRTLCPGIVAPNTFGFVQLEAAESSDGMYGDIPVFAAFSRASNPSGDGFTVESFPASTFTSATTVVTGLRRTIATDTSPAYQTNCFIGNMVPYDTENPGSSSTAFYSIRNNNTTYSGQVTLAPGRMKRFLDIFAAAGLPAGDYNNLAIVFQNSNSIANNNRNGLMTYCTVQDNGTYGADFRIGKQAFGTMGIASNDGMAAREWSGKVDAAGRAFEIGPGNSANTHVVYFKHPDRVQCELLNPTTGARLTAAAGLEIRAFGPEHVESAGGDGQTGTGLIFLGDKADHNGFNNRYTIEVESNEQNTAATRPYSLYCASGSGNTFGYDIIEYQKAIDRF
jgi:hypothetical protein